MKIGFIGLEIMGKPMSKNLLKAGYALVVLDRNTESVEEMVADGAELRKGIEIVTEALGLEQLVKNALLVITGEGRIDSQTMQGKVPIGVERVAKRYHKPVIGIASSLTVDVGVVHQHGLDAVFSVLYSICTLEQALDNAGENVRMAGAQYRRHCEARPNAALTVGARLALAVARAPFVQTRAGLHANPTLPVMARERAAR